LKKGGYSFEGYTDAFAAIEALKAGRFDILVLDFLLESIHGDEVVKKIREFDTDLYILLLTGHKDMAPPLETIRALDIQGYCEKNDRFDQLILLIESAIKTIAQRKTIWQFKDGLNRMLESLPKIYKLQPINNILEDILNEAMLFSKSQNGFIFIDNMINPENIKAENNSMYRGAGVYNLAIEEFMSLLSPSLLGT
jgi:FixJ family two-component response regulator